MMSIEEAAGWMEAHSVPCIRAVRFEGSWIVVLWDRHSKERTGVGKTLEKAISHALGQWCLGCASGACDRW